MRLLSIACCIGLGAATSAAAETKPAPKPAATKTAEAQPAAKKKRKGPRLTLRRSKEVRGRLFRDWDCGLQFAVSKGKLRKLRPGKAAKGVRWEAQVDNGSIVARTRCDSIPEGTLQTEAELIAYLEEISGSYRDPEVEPREVVPLDSDLKDGMGLVQAGASVDVVLPKGRHCCEQLWVLVHGDKRVTLSLRYTSNDARRGRWTKFQYKFLEALKIANTDYWK